MSDDDRAKLRRADALVRGGEIDEAVRLYAEVGRSLRRQGLALKSAAVWKQVGQLSDSGSELATEARAELIQLYRELGLEADADALALVARDLVDPIGKRRTLH